MRALGKSLLLVFLAAPHAAAQGAGPGAPPAGRPEAAAGGAAKSGKTDKDGKPAPGEAAPAHLPVQGPAAPVAVTTDPTPVAPMLPRLPADRPLHTFFQALSPRNEQQKPVALTDPAGFVIASGLLIGQVDQGWVTGLSMTTRKHEWWYDGKVTMTAPPGPFGSSVVLGFRDAKIVRLEVLTGKKLWSVSLDSFTERPFLLTGTTLYVLTAAQVLYALDFQTGKTLWLYDGGFPDGLTIRGGARPVVHDNQVIFGVASGEVIGVAADTGKLVWRYNPSYNDARFHDVVGEMVVRNNKLLLSRYDGLVASIDLASGVRSVVWQQQLPGLTTSTFRGDRFFVGGLNGDVYALDPDAGGRRMWRAITGAPVTTVTAGESLLWVAGAGGRVTALEVANGAMKWADRLGSSLASLPVMAEDAIYFTTGMKAVYGYRIR